MTVAGSSGVRVAELVAALSLATDLGLGQPQEHILRQTVVATRLARAAGLDDNDQAAAFYVSLLAWVGCIADSHELAGWYGDDRQIRADSYQVDRAGLPMLRFLLGHLGQGMPPLRRLTVIGRFLLAGPAEARESFAAHCDTTADIAERLDLPGDVRRALPHALSRWDGKGFPPTLRGDQIAPVMRIVHIADDLEVYHRVGGTAAAVAMLRQRRATEFDPALVDLACACVEDLVLGLDGLDTWETVINGLQPLDRALDEPEFDRALEVMADYADLKSPWFLGHSRAVARLVSAAASTDPAYDELLARRAALVSRLGVTGVSTGTWNRPGPLSFTERERVRTVPYLTERILARAPGLAPLAAVAAMTHERMDGSGYPRGASGSAIVPTARLLAVAETYQALVEERPQRAAWSPARAADLLRAEADEGRLDPGAVRAVLLAAGHRVSRHRPTVASLTPREVEVLVRLVRGRSNRQIAEELHVTPRTVGTHVEHIYRKIQVSTRGAAAMFAMRHGLVDATTATDTD